MKKITLKKLTLENWRARNVSLEFPQGTTEIRAYNGRGKSTLFDAWVWLLVGTDSQDRANYDLFDTNVELSKDTPAAIVEAVLDVDGAELTLKRSAKSQWTRPRGKEEWVKANSDKYSFYVDNVEYQAKQYQDIVSQLFANQDADTIKMMVNPSQSLNLDWKQLRKMFQRIIGEIKEDDYQGDYSSIKEDIARHGFDLAKQAVMNRVTDYKRNLKDINADIAAKERTLPDLAQCDEAEKQITQKKERIAELDAEITGLGEANKPFIEKRKAEEQAIQELQAKISNAGSQYYSKQNEQLAQVERSYRQAMIQAQEVEFYNKSLESRKAQLERDIASAKEDVAFLAETREDLKKQVEAVKARVFTYNDVCPTCGQQMPYDEVKISQARLRFNEAKEQEKEALVQKGWSVRAKLDERQARLEELEAQRPTLSPKEPIDSSKYRIAYKEAQAQVVPYEKTEEFISMQAKLEQLQSNLTVIPDTDVSNFVLEKQQLLTQIQTLSEITAYRNIHVKISRDIDDKKLEQQATASQLAAEEHKLFKFVEYEREHASIVSSRVNKYLKVANVKMLTVNKSGEYQDCCVITCDGVGNTMNRASVIRTRVDVANAFQRYFEIEAPLFVDDCDAIAPELIPQTEGQQIRLIFDKNYIDYDGIVIA
jgi:DNA repair exonuclease SbcCD ATPase subunit